MPSEALNVHKCKAPFSTLVTSGLRSILVLYSGGTNAKFCTYICNIYVKFSALLKVALQILGRKFYKNTKKSSLYSQSLIIFIHKTPVVENHPITGEIRELLRPRSTTTGITPILHEQLSHLHTGNTQKKVSNIASDEDIMKNNYMFVML